MIVQAAILLLVAASFVLWPLLRAQTAGLPPEPGPQAMEGKRRRESEELELDVATGRLSPLEAEARRRELGP